MSEEEYMECSVVAYPREIKFLHITGSAISYCVDRHISDYVDRLQKENQQLQQENEKLHSYKTLYKSLKMQKEELRSWLEEEKERLARECSQIYEDSLGKTRLVNEDIFNEVDMILSKLEELEGVSNE